MSSPFKSLNLLWLICALCLNAAAQKKDRAEILPQISVEASDNGCQELKTGRAISAPKPDYPAEAKAARVGGTVRVVASVDEKGAVGGIERVEGNKLLQTAAANAARKTRFVPTTCAGTPAKAIAVLTYNFIPFVSTASYFAPTRIGDLPDVSADSPFYDAVLNLTENYKLAFGYADKKFYADAPLTRGDFAHALRLTLDLLAARAQAAGKIPRDINLFYARNPQKLASAAEIKNLKAKEPFAESVKILLLKYDVALTNERREFQGASPLTANETIDLWTAIFGADAVPVNFTKTANDNLISRGEFALFLQESLEVLTYKVLP